MKQDEYIGGNSVQYLQQYLNKFVDPKIFLVAKNRSYELSGAKNAFHRCLSARNVLHFSDFGEIPFLNFIQDGVKQFKHFSPDIVLAIGGGNVIDTAKLINYFAAQTVEPLSVINGSNEILHAGKPLIAVPTTSGAGSESTQFAVVYVENVKYSVFHNSILPNVAIVDHQFTHSLSPLQTAISGIDAFSQSIESYWSIQSTVESKHYAKKAIEVILKNLPGAVLSSNNENREAMAQAAHWAGKAINISKTTGPHALSYTMTSVFGIPHGQAVSLTLPNFFEFNCHTTVDTVADTRGIQYVTEIMNDLLQLFGCQTAGEGKHFLLNFMKNIGLRTNLNEVGITNNDIGMLIRSVNIQRLSNNPRKVSESDLFQLIL